MQRESVDDAALAETVEDALQSAIYAAGGMLASNLGAPHKVAWSRSSRTDKSVHSLATVVALKMEVEPDAFEADPEGQSLAAAINSHLPPEVRRARGCGVHMSVTCAPSACHTGPMPPPLPLQVRVFSIQRVSKGWNARSECIRRRHVLERWLAACVARSVAANGAAAAYAQLPMQTLCLFRPSRSYNYYVPASVLGLALDGGEGDAACLALLRTAWERFQGTHPFHNYTKRRLYRDDVVFGDGKRKAGRDRRAEEDARAASSDSAAEGEDEGKAGSSGGSGAAAEDEVVQQAPSDSSSSSSVDGSSSSSSSSSAEGGGSSLRGLIRMEWKGEADKKDLVVRRHYR